MAPSGGGLDDTADVVGDNEVVLVVSGVAATGGVRMLAGVLGLRDAADDVVEGAEVVLEEEEEEEKVGARDVLGEEFVDL